MSVNNGHVNHSHMESIDSLENSQSDQSDRRASLARNRSFDDIGSMAEAKVLVIYTGGTIGMTRNSNNGMYFSNFRLYHLCLE